jgi:tyrosine-protein kinase Etk/Wzc
MIPPSEIKELNLKDYFEIILKNVWIVIASFVVVTGFTAIYELTSPKIYMVKTTIAIETERPKVTGKVEDIYAKEVIDRNYYLTRISLLKSHPLAERILQKTGLDRDPEFINSRDAAGKLLSMVKIEPVSTGNTATIFVKGRDPIKITTIANSWVREFAYQEIEKKVADTKYGITFLENQLSDTLKKLQEAEKDLNIFIRNNKMVKAQDIEARTDALIDSLKSQKAQLEKQIADLLQRYKEKHPKMISMVTQLREVESKLSEETNNRILLQENMAEYGVFKRKVDTYTYLYEDLLKRAKELDISKELTISNIRIVDPAQEPRSPIRPQPLRDIPVAMLISLFIGVGICLSIEHLDSSLKTSDDVEFYAKLPFLGYIPSAKDELKDKNDLNFIAHLKPHSRAAESFRNLKVSLIFSFPEDKPLKTIAVTSSIPGEGKSFVSTNLAIVFAQSKEPTLLIDADMHKGSIGKTFNIKKKDGLSNLLAGAPLLDEAIVSTSIPNLFVLTSGIYTPNPTELLSSERLPKLLRELEKRFKRIIVDSTPILNVSEAIILGDKCDGLLFVIRATSTSLNYILEAKKMIDKKVKIIGATLNDTDMKRERYYYYYNYPAPQEKT